MKRSTLLSFIIFILCLSSCNNEETTSILDEPEDIKPKNNEEDILVTYFTLNGAGYSAYEKNWLLIHNQNGELLDYQQYNAGDSITFETEESKLNNTTSLTITTLRYNGDGTSNHFKISTLTDIELQTEWDQKNVPMSNNSTYLNNLSGYNKTQLSESNKSQNINISINGLLGVERYSLISKENYIIKSEDIFQDTDNITINNVLLSTDIEYLLSIEDGEGVLKYYKFSPQENSNSINISWDNFLDYDEILTVSLPDHNFLHASVAAYETETFADTPLLLTNQSSGGPLDSLARFGYIDSYPSFDTYFTIRVSENYEYGYEELGSIPKTISILEKPELIFKNTTLEGFEFHTDITYLSQINSWGYVKVIPDISINDVSWVIQQPFGSNSKIGAIPQEILEQYPSLDLKNLTFKSTTLYLQGKNYQEVLDSSLNSNNVFGNGALKYEWLIFYNSKS